MPRKPKVAPTAAPLLDLTDTLRTAVAVPAIRQEVRQWQAKGNPGITATTKTLLKWWFNTDHRINGKTFRFYPAQRDAIETLIYLFEVKKIHKRADLLLNYAKGQKVALPTYDEFARYALKMATGSGKTKVMALAIAWQYFNAVRAEGNEYASTFLMIAPNVIVLERLATDFTSGRIFTKDPIIPKEFKFDWDLDVYIRGDTEKTSSQGALYLTNIQQLYERAEEEDSNPVSSLLGPKPPTSTQPVESFIDRIIRRGNTMVLNDEAHHTNDKAQAWNQVITNLHDKLAAKEQQVTIQLDVSATPRQSDGTLFSWTIYDYPLKQAILDQVVKRPIRGVAQGIAEVASDKASVRYEAYLVAAVERWKEYVTSLEKLKKKPILFLMMYDTSSADDVANWLRTKYPADFAGDKLLVIHTDKGGEISKKDLDAARKVAREVDNETSPVNCIVSVLMLREGWDVNNVTVVAGLRPFSSKANVLPEQAVGRGLRLMFRDITGYHEHVDIIGNDAFMEVVSDLEKEEGIKLDTFEYGKKKTALVIPTIEVLPDRVAAYDIAIPILSRRIERKKNTSQVITDLKISDIRLKTPLEHNTVAPNSTFTYEGRDVITDDVIVTRSYTMPQAKTSSEIIAFYAQNIAQRLKLASQFSRLVPKIEEFLREKAFGKTVNLDEPAILAELNRPHVLVLTEKVFSKLLLPLLNDIKKVSWSSESMLVSSTEPFPYSGKIADVKKTLFNLTPVGNDFEQEFAHFLDTAPEVAAFANIGNLPKKLSIEYLDSQANLRFYEPDFVARTTTGEFWLLETKGREDAEVALKDQRAIQWCEDVSTHTKQSWKYLKIPDKEFRRIKPKTLNELVASFASDSVLIEVD